jgi:hypothetical protein
MKRIQDRLNDLKRIIENGHAKLSMKDEDKNWYLPKDKRDSSLLWRAPEGFKDWACEFSLRPLTSKEVYLCGYGEDLICRLSDIHLSPLPAIVAKTSWPHDRGSFEDACWCIVAGALLHKSDLAWIEWTHTEEGDTISHGCWAHHWNGDPQFVSFSMSVKHPMLCRAWFSGNDTEGHE